jgi:hypothetical protein
MHFRRLTLLVFIALVAPATRAYAQAQPQLQPQAIALPTDTAKLALLRQIISQSHAAELAVSAMEASLPAQRAAHPEIPAAFWDRFIALAHARSADLENMIIVIYDKHFSTDELRQLLAFYGTPAGKKLLDAQPTILQESMAAGRDWGQRLGMEVAQQLDAESRKP